MNQNLANFLVIAAGVAAGLTIAFWLVGQIIQFM